MVGEVDHQQVWMGFLPYHGFIPFCGPWWEAQGHAIRRRPDICCLLSLLKVATFDDCLDQTFYQFRVIYIEESCIEPETLDKANNKKQMYSGSWGTWSIQQQETTQTPSIPIRYIIEAILLVASDKERLLMWFVAGFNGSFLFTTQWQVLLVLVRGAHYGQLSPKIDPT